MPAWEIRAFGYTHPAAVLADRGPAGILTICRCSIRSSRRGSQGQGAHNLLPAAARRPRRARALGAMAIAFYLVLAVSGGNDIIADKFHISLNAMTWAGRIGLLICRRWRTYVPSASASVCSSTTVRCWRTASRPASSSACPTAVHRGAPAARRVDAHGTRAELPYVGWTVPKKMNRLGALAPGGQGLLLPDRANRCRPRTAGPAAFEGRWRQGDRQGVGQERVENALTFCGSAPGVLGIKSEHPARFFYAQQRLRARDVALRPECPDRTVRPARPRPATSPCRRWR
jgi:hypothetical protein